MPIDVTCQCGRSTSVPDQYAGKKGKCPACGAVIPIPATLVPVPIADVEPEPEAVQLPPRAAYVPPTPPAPAPTPQAPAEPVITCLCGVSLKWSPYMQNTKASCPACDAILYMPDRDGKFAAPHPAYSPTIQRVHLIDADMPFPSMCIFIAKWTCAAFPTALVLWLLYFMIATMASGPEPRPRF